jgi:5-methylcytosine-specific restriction endonuclease McrA
VRTYEQRTGSTHQWRKLRARALRELPLVCVFCSTALDPSAPRGSRQAPELDHIVPAKYGGPDVIENVQWTCSPCNRSKSDRGASRGEDGPTVKAPRTFVTERTW